MSTSNDKSVRYLSYATHLIRSASAKLAAASQGASLPALPAFKPVPPPKPSPPKAFKQSVGSPSQPGKVPDTVSNAATSGTAQPK